MRLSLQIDWLDFREYLSKTCNQNTVKIRLFYAKKYSHVLTGRSSEYYYYAEANSLLQLSAEKRLNVQKSITALSKFLGIYDQWQQMRKRYSLKWTNPNQSLQSFERFFNPDLSLDSMLQRIKEMIAKTPLQIGQIIKFACLTGLRPSEVVESVRLLNLSDGGEVDKPKYYNPQRQALEHFRFPDIFLRQTKKAYISFVSPEIVEIVKKLSSRLQSPSYNAIRLAIYKQGIKCDMRYCRKLFDSHLIKSGIDSTTVDMLQGRVGKSVLLRHYQTPDSTLADRVLQAVHELKREMEG
jgi:Archaeal phage integrase